jgi:hypothetical protein
MFQQDGTFVQYFIPCKQLTMFHPKILYKSAIFLEHKKKLDEAITFDMYYSFSTEARNT